LRADQVLSTPSFPSLYQINTRVWLEHLSREVCHSVTLDHVPDWELDQVAESGFDWVYLLGVWQTGAAGRAISASEPEWRREFERLLPDLREEDICGSCFAITEYSVSSALGGDAALARFRARLAKRGLRLMLDFVPNHTAPDHPWVREHPDFYVPGTEADLAGAPRNYCRVDSAGGSRILAHGRDPYFPGWSDTLQLNYGNPAVQEAMTSLLSEVAVRCDGVRCDMAMLILPDVFARTWGISSQPFWPEAIEHVKAAQPGFVFMAEVYWDLEWTLQQQGFDYTYDKRLYDRLRSGPATIVRDHLCADPDFQHRSTRFLENHDEPRAAATFPPGQHQAAAVIAFLVPGMRFLHQGQLEGRRLFLPVHLCRAPKEPVDEEVEAFYERLLTVLRLRVVRGGRWRLLECTPAWQGNWTWAGFVAFAWEAEDPGAGGVPEPLSAWGLERSPTRLLVVVNYQANQGQCHVTWPFAEPAPAAVRFVDLMGTATYERDGGDLESPGLYLDLAAWGYNVFAVE
jgi:hypothetical protein